MGTDLSISEGYRYYNSTLSTSDWDIYLRGFACAAYATLDMPDAQSRFVDTDFLVYFDGHGYGSGVGLEFDPFKDV